MGEGASAGRPDDEGSRPAPAVSSSKGTAIGGLSTGGAVLVPGVLPDDPESPGNPASKSGLNYRDIGGDAGVSRDNFYYIDGINVTDGVSGTFGANLNTEIIQEQQVLTGGIPAEYVGAPGDEPVVLKQVVDRAGELVGARLGDDARQQPGRADRGELHGFALRPDQQQRLRRLHPHRRRASGSGRVLHPLRPERGRRDLPGRARGRPRVRQHGRESARGRQLRPALPVGAGRAADPIERPQPVPAGHVQRHRPPVLQRRRPLRALRAHAPSPWRPHLARQHPGERVPRASRGVVHGRL